MSKFGRTIRPHVQAELRAALEAEAQGQSSAAFGHLERAHVLGQASTVEHVRVHWRMFLWGLRQRSVRECLGQVLRIAGAATKTAVGLVPYGNTGGSNVSPFKRMPVSPELEALIQRA
ncbi:MAG: DUF3703 domain-containing protein, partial [Sulfuricaulis sp.]|nr:DUF3703 domain-containing protein [Sulfuricaulis sp.]